MCITVIGLALFSAHRLLRTLIHLVGLMHHARQRHFVCCLFGNSHSFLHTIAEIINTDGITAASSHLCLVYLKRQQVMNYIRALKDLGGIGLKLETTCFTYLHFEFICSTVHFEVKHCGMRVVFEQDLEEFSTVINNDLQNVSYCFCCPSNRVLH